MVENTKRRSAFSKYRIGRARVTSYAEHKKKKLFQTSPERGIGVGRRKRDRGALFFIVVPVILGITLFGTSSAIRFVYRLSQDLPTVSQMQNIEQALTTKVLAKDGKVLHEFSIEHRIRVPLAGIPVNLLNAVVAVEDHRFYKHWGIDLRRIAQAAVIEYRQERVCPGRIHDHPAACP